MNDAIADMMVRFKNASDVRKDSVEFPFTKLKYAICELLKKEGFIEDVTIKGKKPSTKAIEVTLKYVGKTAKITGVSRVSKLSKRVYGGVHDIKPVRQGRGLLILSTPKGIMKGEDAKKEKVGGELLCKVW